MLVGLSLFTDIAGKLVVLLAFSLPSGELDLDPDSDFDVIGFVVLFVSFSGWILFITTHDLTGDAAAVGVVLAAPFAWRVKRMRVSHYNGFYKEMDIYW